MASEMTDEARQRAGWTRERPTETGWYWWRETAQDFPHAVLVWPGDGDVKLVKGGFWRDAKELDNTDGEWRGPMTPDDGDREYQRGLEAAANVVRAQAGGLTREACAGCGNEDDVAEGAANDALRYAADTLDRLAQEARW